MSHVYTVDDLATIIRGTRQQIPQSGRRIAEIIYARYFVPERRSLSELARIYGVSRERIRQLEQLGLDRLARDQSFIASLPMESTLRLRLAEIAPKIQASQRSSYRTLSPFEQEASRLVLSLTECGLPNRTINALRAMAFAHRDLSWLQPEALRLRSDSEILAVPGIWSVGLRAVRSLSSSRSK